MKVIIILSGLLIGIILGLYPSLNKPKPLIWKIFAILFVSASIILTLLPPTAANVTEARFFAENLPGANAYFVCWTTPSFNNFNKNTNTWTTFISDVKSPDSKLLVAIKGDNLPDEFRSMTKIVAQFYYDQQTRTFTYVNTVAKNPSLTLPFMPQFQERIRIINFHVPMSWVAVLAYLISMIYAIRYLTTRKIVNDNKAATAAALGTMFCILATITGMIWAKFNWGTFWNWDPRETSIFILLLIYGAYFALRAALENEELKARLSSVYSIIAFITVPFFIFVLPRITTGLHPGSSTESNAGTVVSNQSGLMNSYQQITFGISLGAFTMLFFWLLNIAYRTKRIELENQDY